MRLLGVIAAFAFVGCLLAANWMTAAFGMVPVGLGLTATCGTYIAGACFVLRDVVSDALGRAAVLALVVVGSVLSAALEPRLAIASGLAFLVSETADMLVYEPLRRRGYLRAALASNVVGACVDTIVFLTVAGFPLALGLPGQVVGKLWLTIATVILVAGCRALLRQSVHASRA